MYRMVGILHFPGGSISCKGNWKEGKMNGVFEHCQGKIESEFKKNFYPSVMKCLISSSGIQVLSYILMVNMLDPWWHQYAS